MMENFDLSGKVIIEFYGEGCFNCQLMTPVLKNLERIMSDVRFYRINADYHPKLVQQYQVTSLPSLIHFRDGRMLSTIVGQKSQLALQMMIEDILNYA